MAALCRRRAAAARDGDRNAVLTKRPHDAMGLSWVDHTLLERVEPWSPADAGGLGRFVGRRVTHVNGRPVQRLSDIEPAHGATTVRFVFAEQWAKAADVAVVARRDNDVFSDQGSGGDPPPPRDGAELWLFCPWANSTQQSKGAHDGQRWVY
eukprot:gene7732-46114_t